MTILVTGATGECRPAAGGRVGGGGCAGAGVDEQPGQGGTAAGVEVARGVSGAGRRRCRRRSNGVDTVYLAPLPAYVDDFVACARDGRRAAGRRAVGGACGVRGAGGSGGRGTTTRWSGRSRRAGFEWTFLRPGQFMNNTLGLGAARSRPTGWCGRRTPEAVQTPIDLADIAAVARVVLLDESYTGRKMMMSGPEAITQPEEVAWIAAAIGREVRFEELTREEALGGWAPVMGARDGAVAAGRVPDDVGVPDDAGAGRAGADRPAGVAVSRMGRTERGAFSAEA